MGVHRAAAPQSPKHRGTTKHDDRQAQVGVQASSDHPVGVGSTSRLTTYVMIYDLDHCDRSTYYIDGWPCQGSDHLKIYPGCPDTGGADRAPGLGRGTSGTGGGCTECAPRCLFWPSCGLILDTAAPPAPRRAAPGVQIHMGRYWATNACVARSYTPWTLRVDPTYRARLHAWMPFSPQER